jgi:hypothetical protein
MPVKDVELPWTDKVNDPNDHRDDPEFMTKLESLQTDLESYEMPGINNEAETDSDRESSDDWMNKRYAVVSIEGKTQVVKQKQDPVTGYIADQF